ncbi:Uncharacterised protein [Klebsiella pneumoniae]|nr:Uncharacterised protein [Klebsiella pneumoniae]
MAVINAIIHSQRLGYHKVPAHHIDMRALQRCVAQTHRQTGGDIEL